MSRGLHASNLAAIESATLKPVYLVKIEFTSGNLYLSSSTHDVVDGATTYTGDGSFLGFEGIRETDAQRANDCQIMLSGDDLALRSLVLSYTNQTLKGTVLIGFLDSANVLVVTPQIIFYGNFSSATIEDSAGSSTIRIQYENELLEQKAVQEFRYTNFSQRALYPDDSGFRYASSAEDWNGYWGKAEKVKFIKKRKNRR